MRWLLKPKLIAVESRAPKRKLGELFVFHLNFLAPFSASENWLCCLYRLLSVRSALFPSNLSFSPDQSGEMGEQKAPAQRCCGDVGWWQPCLGPAISDFRLFFASLEALDSFSPPGLSGGVKR